MKRKHLFALLVAVALLVTAGVFAVQADPEGTVCSHCNSPVAAEDWKPWSFTSGNATAGHYYLPENYAGQTANIGIPAGAEVCLDLRGNTYQTEGVRMFMVRGTLSVMDSVGGGMVLTTGRDNAEGSFTFVESTGEVNIYGGTFQFVEREDITIPGGGLIYVTKGKLNIHGGTIRGGVIRPNVDTSGQGGNIYLNGATMTMDGGTVTGGMARINDEEGNLRTMQGGNIYALGGSVINISGGTISNGYSDQDGGNIFVGAATLNISGGTISGGHARRNGGNIQQLSESANSITISGGEITGGVAGGQLAEYANDTYEQGLGGGGNLSVDTKEGTLTISGGTIDGDIIVSVIDTLTLSGEPRIGIGKSNGMMFINGMKADVSGLTGNAKIYVCATTNFTTNLTDETAAQAALAYFEGAVRTNVSVNGSALKGSKTNESYCPHCWNPEAPQKVQWINNWASDLSSGHYYVDEYTNVGLVTLDGSADVVLDMNGHTISSEEAVVHVKSGSLAILDSFGGGKIQGKGSVDGDGVFIVTTAMTLDSGTLRQLEDSSVAGGGLVVAPGETAELTINGGVIRNGIVNTVKEEAAPSGGNVAMTGSGSVFSMSGGILSKGQAVSVVSGDTTYSSKGGNLYTAGTATVSGGFIMDGAAADGGNVYSEQLTLDDTTICGGTATANGGNLNVVNGINMTGSTVASGSASKGGNLYVVRGLDMTDSVVVGGSATNGGNLYVVEGLTMTGSMVADGSAATNGGNLYLTAHASDRNITGSTFVGGTATSGGSIYQYGTTEAKGTMSLTNVDVLFGFAESGGNIYLVRSALNVNPGTVVFGGVSEGTTDSDSGGNIMASGSTVTIDGATVANGTTQKRGGNIYALGGTTLTVKNSAKITGGSSDMYGGNIALASAATVVTLEGGTISDGYAYNAGDNVCLLGNPTLNIQNVSIPGSVYGDNGTITLSGTATVVDGEYYNIRFNKGRLQVDENWEGDAGVKWAGVSFTYGQIMADTYGRCGTFGDTFTAGGDYTGTLIYESLSDKPWIFGVNGGLLIADSRLIGKDGSKRWFVDNTSAIASYDDTTAYMRCGQSDMVLIGGDYLVDLAGKNVGVSGTGAVTFFDSSNDTYETFGTATFTDPALLANDTMVKVFEKQYVKMEKEGVYSFHRLDMRVNGIAIRPVVAGVYFSCIWNCDETLSDNIRSFGVAVSVKDMPMTDFRSDGDTMWSAYGKDAFVKGEARNSVLIQHILREGNALNDGRGKTDIYVAPYLIVEDGTQNGAAAVAEKVTAYSLYDAMLLMDGTDLYNANMTKLEEFYAQWKDPMSGWGFQNIGKNPPAA